MRKLSVAYHKAIKKLANLKPWDSNHVACESVGADIFKHLVTKRMLQHYRSLITSNSDHFRSLRYFFIFKSKIRNDLDVRFVKMYDVLNFVVNDFSALISRIKYIQNHEPRSNYVYLD